MLLYEEVAIKQGIKAVIERYNAVIERYNDEEKLDNLVDRIYETLWSGTKRYKPLDPVDREELRGRWGL